MQGHPRMKWCFLPFLVLAILGCNTEESNRALPVTNEPEENAEGLTSIPPIDSEAWTDASLSLRDELDAYLEKHRIESDWTYGERTPGELRGSWATVDRSDSLIIFDLNGQAGVFSQDFNGHRSVGLYAVSRDGQIIGYSKWNDIGRGSRWKIEGVELVGPRGPSPKVRWRRVTQNTD